MAQHCYLFVPLFSLLLPQKTAVRLGIHMQHHSQALGKETVLLSISYSAKNQYTDPEKKVSWLCHSLV